MQEEREIIAELVNDEEIIVVEGILFDDDINKCPTNISRVGVLLNLTIIFTFIGILVAVVVSAPTHRNSPPAMNVTI
jgi:hypothetical protein